LDVALAPGVALLAAVRTLTSAPVLEMLWSIGDIDA